MRQATSGPLFAAPELGLFEHSVTHTADTLVDLLRSRSYYLTATEEQQQDLEVPRARARRAPPRPGRALGVPAALRDPGLPRRPARPFSLHTTVRHGCTSAQIQNHIYSDE
jgi:hypothetical protein